MGQAPKVAIVVSVMVLVGLGVASCGDDGKPPGIHGTYVLDGAATEAALQADIAAWVAAVEAGTGSPADAALAQEAQGKALVYLREGRWTAEMSLSPDGAWDGWYEWRDPEPPPPPPPEGSPPASPPAGASPLKPHRVLISGTWTLDGDRVTFDVRESRDGDFPRSPRPARFDEGRIELLSAQGRAVEVFRRK